MPLPQKVLRATLVLNAICNELALTHLWWAGLGRLPLDAVWRLALLYSLPGIVGFCGMRALLAGPVKRLCHPPLPSWATTSSGLWHKATTSSGLWYNILAPALFVFLAWGTEVY